MNTEQVTMTFTPHQLCPIDVSILDDNIPQELHNTRQLLAACEVFDFYYGVALQYPHEGIFSDASPYENLRMRFGQFAHTTTNAQFTIQSFADDELERIGERSSLFNAQ